MAEFLTVGEVKHLVESNYRDPGQMEIEGLVEVLLDQSAEKACRHVGGDKERRAAELKIIRKSLDRLEAAYQDELEANEMGVEPVYHAVV